MSCVVQSLVPPLTLLVCDVDTTLATSVLSTTLPAPLPSLPQTLSGTKCPLTSSTPSVHQGGPPQYRARPTWDLAANAAAGVVSIYKQELARYTEYTLAESALSTALLASIGDTNAVLLKTTYPAIKPTLSLRAR